MTFPLPSPSGFAKTPYSRREARASSLVLFVSLDDRQGFERSDRTGKGLTSVLEDLDYADDIVLLTP